MNTLSIKHYQEKYPHASAIQSITQSGGLAAVLERVEQKHARQQRRLAARRNIAKGAAALMQAIQRRLQAIQQRLARRPETRSAVVQPRRVA